MKPSAQPLIHAALFAGLLLAAASTPAGGEQGPADARLPSPIAQAQRMLDQMAFGQKVDDHALRRSFRGARVVARRYDFISTKYRVEHEGRPLLEIIVAEDRSLAGLLVTSPLLALPGGVGAALGEVRVGSSFKQLADRFTDVACRHYDKKVGCELAVPGFAVDLWFPIGPEADRSLPRWPARIDRRQLDGALANSAIEEVSIFPKRTP